MVHGVLHPHQHPWHREGTTTCCLMVSAGTHGPPCQPTRSQLWGAWSPHTKGMEWPMEDAQHSFGFVGICLLLAGGGEKGHRSNAPAHPSWCLGAIALYISRDVSQTLLRSAAAEGWRIRVPPLICPQEPWGWTRSRTTSSQRGGIVPLVPGVLSDGQASQGGITGDGDLWSPGWMRRG